MGLKKLVGALAAAAVGLGSVSPAAFADEKRSQHHRSVGVYGDFGNHGRNGWQDRRYDNRNGWGYGRDNRYGRGWNNGWSNNGYGYAYGDGHRYRRHDDNGTALGIGLGVVGLALVLAAANGGKNKDRIDDRRVQRERDDRRGGPDWNNPDDAAYSRVPAGQSAYAGGVDDSRCLQTREYQTRITVGGESRPAYGTACLMPDGQWLQGEPILEPR
jgi:hypothetical protein